MEKKWSENGIYYGNAICTVAYVEVSKNERIQMVCILRYYFLTLAIYNHRMSEWNVWTKNEYESEWARERGRERYRKKSELSTMRGNLWMYPRDRYCVANCIKLLLNWFKVQRELSLVLSMLVQKKEKTELQAQIDLSMHVQVYERKREREHLYLSGTYRCLASHDLSYLRKGILNILLGGKKKPAHFSKVST